jgi:multidrug efflux pump subunit AcrA (membrane-fusion protein)
MVISVLVLSCKNSVQPKEAILLVKTPVTVVPVELKPVTSTFGLPAVTSFMNKSIIRASTAGTIEKISITQGGPVSADQILFSIRTREGMALRKEAIGDSSLSFRGLIDIRAQKAGVVSTLSHQKGDIVLEGDELAVVSDQSSLVFILEVPFEFESYVAKNRKCTVVLPDSRQIKATISGKLSEMDIQSQTIRYIVKPDGDVRLPVNLICSVKMIKTENTNALVLPKQAVLGNETQTEFWIMKVINDSTAIKVPVKKGFENNDEVEIEGNGIVVSDRIILTGNYGLPDTARIGIIKE